MLTGCIRKVVFSGASLAILALLVPGTPLSAQPSRPAAAGTIFNSPDAGDTPGVDSPTIYQSFFMHQHQLSTWIASQSAADPVKGRELVKAATKVHRIQEADYENVTAISHSVVAGLEKVDSGARAELRAAKASGTAPNADALQRYAHTRQLILGDGIQKLQSSLSPESWKGLHAYLNNEHRPQIHQAKAVKTEQR